MSRSIFQPKNAPKCHNLDYRGFKLHMTPWGDKEKNWEVALTDMEDDAHDFGQVVSGLPYPTAISEAKQICDSVRQVGAKVWWGQDEGEDQFWGDNADAGNVGDEE